MASCNLTIEINEPNRIYQGGEIVRGHVLVQVTKKTQCNGLKIKSMWETHGKGNVDTGVWRDVTLDSGTWQAGYEKRYPFELECAPWPPTYRGTYVNIDHYIAAQVDVPWAFDPKAKQPFQVAPNGNPDAEQLQAVTKVSNAGPIATAFFVVFLCIVGFFVVFHPCAWIVLLIGGIWAFFTKYLPKRKLGDVNFEIQTSRVPRGGTLEAALTLKPGGNTQLNGINYTITASEVVVRGHGTDRKTYTHQLLESKGELAGQGALVGGQENRFPIAFPIAADAPFSFKLDDNKLVWKLAIHVDIPRWPDWKKSEEFEVILAEEDADGLLHTAPTDAASVDERLNTDPVRPPSSAVSFEDTCGLIAKVRTDFDQLERVLSAVANQSMSISVLVHRRLSSGAVDDEVGYQNGVTYEGEHDGQQLLIFAPSSRVADMDACVGSFWEGLGTIVGYDRTIGSLQIKVQ